MTTYDISRKIAPGEAVYEGDDPLGESVVCDIGEEAPCRITGLENWTTHFLTHVDAPRHFYRDGITLDQIALERFMGPAVVVDIGDAAEVLPSHIPLSVIRGASVLFKTRNSFFDSRTFHEDHAYVGEDAAAELVRRGVNLVGIDYLSVDKFGDEDYPAHMQLLGAQILVLEGTDLSEVEPGSYTLVALPLAIAGADGSPVRAVLVDTSPAQ